MIKVLYRIYFLLPNFSLAGLPGKIINRGMAMILKRLFDAFLPRYLKKTAEKAGSGLNTSPRKEKYIVSLTSFPGRIDQIWITLEIIFRQKFKPDMIILWLSSDQFPEQKIPESLESLCKRGLSVEFREDDLKAHKKYYYAMQEYPDAMIITLDDDLYYDYNAISNLVRLHEQYPDHIVTNRAHRFTFDKNGSLNAYRKWKHNVSDVKPSFMLMATGGAGTLYPPGSLPSVTYDKEVFRSICFQADDIWLKSMSLLNKTMIVTNKKYNKDFLTIGSTQKQKLVSSNVFSGGNDVQFKDVCTHYKIHISDFKEQL